MHEQECGVGQAAARVAVDELLPTFLTYFDDSGSDSKNENRLLYLLDQLKTHGIVSEVDNKHEFTIRPLIVHLANPETLTALLRELKEKSQAPSDMEEFLPFRKIRVRCSELREVPLPGQGLLIIENETCQHQLPHVPNTVAVLGAGFDLSWTEAAWLATKKVAYWGDIDTWGLLFLAKARTTISRLEALLMTEEIYDDCSTSTVPEPVVASAAIPTGLNQDEARLYGRLFQEKKGRLEQEFLPPELIQQRILQWIASVGLCRL